MGSTNATIRKALEASDLPEVVSGPAWSWPSSPEAFDATHRLWCEQILAALHLAGVTTASFGRAAKIVAIYLKTRVVCSGGQRTCLAACATSTFGTAKARRRMNKQEADATARRV